jgi:phosphatidate cytidylyltransferase
LLTRILTALPLFAGFLAGLYLASPPVWMGIMAVALLLAALEWGALAGLKTPWEGVYGLGLGLSGLVLAAYGQDFTPAWLLSLLFWLAAPWLLYRGTPLRAGTLGLALGALILLPTFLAMVQLQRQAPHLLLAVVGLVMVADSAAYFIGRRFGRHKLAPRISPGKTWEGVLGAWLAVTLFALAGRTFWPHALALGWTMVLLAAWALLFLAVVGDLMESWIKRQAGVKDSGRLLPGHGGVLDRIDSLTAALPAAALFHSCMQ